MPANFRCLYDAPPRLKNMTQKYGQHKKWFKWMLSLDISEHNTQVYVCLYYQCHFVLVHIQGHFFFVYDSLRGYAPFAAKANLENLKKCVLQYLKPANINSYSIQYMECQQQIQGENDCAFHVANNLYRVLFHEQKDIISRAELSINWKPNV